MDTLIKQLTATIEKRDGLNSTEAAAKALREIVLSGMSRGGFLKECVYLPGLDRFEKNSNTLYLCFLHQNAPEDFLKEYFMPFVKIELEAAGINDSFNETENGFSVEFDGVKCCAFIYHKSFDLQPEYSYQQQPIPYELRSISSMLEGARTEIEQALENEIAPLIEKVEHKKSTAKSSGKKKKQAKEAKDDWIQPSLFDF